MVTHEVSLGVGRFIVGAGASCFTVVIGKLCVETIPGHLVAQFAMSISAMMSIGFIPVFGLAAFLPDFEDKEALKNDEMWRLIWLGPAAVGVIMILLVLTVYR